MGIHQKTFDKKLAIFEKQVGAFMAAAVSRGDLQLHDAALQLHEVINDRLISTDSAKEGS